jgi:solute carrier family 25 (mitochondrial phosphate transporter), member 23/24/25/41
VSNCSNELLRFERLQPWLLREGETRVTPLRKLVGGAVAGIVSVGVTYPLDFVRARLTVQGGLSTTHYTGVIDALRGIARTEGALALYRGITPTVIGVAPYVGLNFMVFETLRATAPVNAEGKPSTFFLLACGAVAGACGQTAAYPLDLLRRRFQVSGLQTQSSSRAGHYKSTLGGLVWIVRTEGVRGLYKGLAPNFVKVVPSIAIMFTTNELLQRALASES